MTGLAGKWKLGMGACAFMWVIAGCSSSDGGPGTYTPTPGTGSDPTTVPVGGTLAGVSATADTDGDGISDVTEGTGDANRNGVPAHLDPSERGTGGVSPGGDPPDTPPQGGPSVADDGGMQGPKDEPNPDTPTGDADDPTTKGNDLPGHVACGNSVTDCDQSSHVCCVSAAMTTECKAGSECGFGNTATVCDGPEDCPGGEVCCVHVKGVSANNTCEPASPVNRNGGRCAPVGGLGDFELCHTDDDCDPSAICNQDSRVFSFWGFCK